MPEFVQGDLRDTFGVWVASFEPWEWWFTGTFRNEHATVHGASRAFERWAGDLQQSYIYVIEGNPSRGGVHVHAVMSGGNQQGIRRKDAWRSWYTRFGVAKLMPFDPSRAGPCGRYLSKYLTKSACWWNAHIEESLMGRRVSA